MMKKTRLYLTGLLLVATVTTTMARKAEVGTNSARVSASRPTVGQMEFLDRGLVALPPLTGTGIFLSWRLLGTDPQNTTFDVVRDGVVVKSDLKVTNYKDVSGTTSSQYQVVTKVNGEEVETSRAVVPWAEKYLRLPLNRPEKGANGGMYTPNDCSVGDVDGDGEYELFVKWDPDNSKDNSQSGITDNVYLDCYKVYSDGTEIVFNGKPTSCKLLWRIDLGKNIRAGAHYTQYMVYDFDGDGRAELMCKTAPGSIDGTGEYVNQAATDETIKNASNTAVHRNSNGRITGGQEYLTVFEGATGRALHTIFYNPNRDQGYGGAASGSFNWGAPDGKSDAASYGNRGERYLAAVAWLDGPDKNPAGIFCRGYYGYAFVWAVGFDGTKLYQKWLHKSLEKTKYSVITYDASGSGTTETVSGLKPVGQSSGSATMFANGNHNMTVGDVDGDGRDEVIWGSAALDDDGYLLYATGFGHGDAIHMGDMIPGRKGMQVFQVHEEKGTYSWDLHDAATGEIIFKGGDSGVDNGRGMAAQLSSKSQEWWFSSANERSQRSTVTGEIVTTNSSSVNFRIYWNGTAQDQLLDGNKVDYYDSSNKVQRVVTFSDHGPGSTCNGTKNTPNLQADIFGDWREEVILYNIDTNGEAYLGVYSTSTVTKYAVPTLMHDHTYRLAVAWQNTAYNQPPHLGYNLALTMLPAITDTNMEQQAVAGSAYTFTGKLKNSTTVYMLSTTLPDGTKLGTNKLPEGFELTKAADMSSFTLTGTPEALGDYEFVFRLVGYNGESVNETLTLHVVESIPGDVNGDGKVNVGDIMAVINVMATNVYDDKADVNQDGNVNVGDIMAVINIMASK